MKKMSKRGQRLINVTLLIFICVVVCGALYINDRVNVRPELVAKVGE